MGTNTKQVLDEWQAWANSTIESKFQREQLRVEFIADNALALIGIRRSGKTFYALDLASKLKKKFLYVNFEDPYFISNNSTGELDKLIETYTEYELAEPELLVLDEIQNINSWERWIRKAIDLRKYQIIITGSSAKLLSSEIASSLTGRSISHNIWPLSFKEFLNFKQIKPHQNKQVTPQQIKPTHNEYLAYFHKYMLEGAFPEPSLLEKQTARVTQLRQYFEDILHKDIVKRYEIRSTRNLYLIANYCLTNLSSQHSTHSIKKALNINPETVGDYLRYMEDAFLLFGVNRYHPNLKVQARDAQKIYVIDNGLRNAISRSKSEDYGKLAENAVFIELKRRSKEIYYYKEKQEVDFIITENFKAKEAIQVCYSVLEDPKTYNRATSALVACIEELKLKEGLILTKDREEVLRLNKKTIRIVPLYKWFLGL